MLFASQVFLYNAAKIREAKRSNSVFHRHRHPIAVQLPHVNLFFTSDMQINNDTTRRVDCSQKGLNRFEWCSCTECRPNAGSASRLETMNHQILTGGVL